MNYKLWNKIDDIKGFNAKYWIDKLGISEDDGVFIVIDKVNTIRAVEIDRIIKSEYNLDINLTLDEVAQEYLRIKEEERLQTEKEQVTLEKQAEKISILEAENEKLRVKQEQQNEDILVNMLAITEMYESNRSFAVSTLESSSRNKVPAYIQTIYQKLYELKIKSIEEIPSEVRENIKNI